MPVDSKDKRCYNPEHKQRRFGIFPKCLFYLAGIARAAGWKLLIMMEQVIKY